MGVERYRSPLSGSRATMVLPWFSGPLCQLRRRPHGGAGGDAHQDALGPGQLPAGGVGVRVRDGEDLVDDGAVQVLRHEVGPDALEAVGTRMALRQQGRGAGSKATICTAGSFAIRYRPVPVTVPPVPAPATKMSTFPSVSAQISGPVVAS